MQDYSIYQSDDDSAPIIFLLTGDENGAKVLELTRNLTASPFSLAVIPVAD